MVFHPQSMYIMGNIDETNKPCSTKNPKEGYDFIYVGTFTEFFVSAFFSFAFWLTMIVINSSNWEN